METWKDIVGFEGLYQVSNNGKVKSMQRRVCRIRMGKKFYYNISEKILTPCRQSNGYSGVTLWKNQRQYVFRVHVIVADAFLPNDPSKTDINHKNGKKDDNRLDNLERCTRRDNIIHSYKLGLSGQNKLGDNDPRRKPVLQYDLNMNFISEYSGQHEASRQTNIRQSDISQCCRGGLKTAGGYKWTFKW